MREILKTVKQKLVSKYLDNRDSRKLNKKLKKFNPRIKARLRVNKQILSKNIDNFFDWF